MTKTQVSFERENSLLVVVSLKLKILTFFSLLYVQGPFWKFMPLFLHLNRLLK